MKKLLLFAIGLVFLLVIISVFSSISNENTKDFTARSTAKIIEIRKPRKNILENVIVGKIQFKGINEKYIRVGAGMKYKSDDTGWLPETDLLYVLEEKDGWIRFRVTEKDFGWSAWIQKDLTTSIQIE